MKRYCARFDGVCEFAQGGDGFGVIQTERTVACPVRTLGCVDESPVSANHQCSPVLKNGPRSAPLLKKFPGILLSQSRTKQCGPIRLVEIGNCGSVITTPFACVEPMPLVSTSYNRSGFAQPKYGGTTALLLHYGYVVWSSRVSKKFPPCVNTLVNFAPPAAT